MSGLSILTQSIKIKREKKQLEKENPWQALFDEKVEDSKEVLLKIKNCEETIEKLKQKYKGVTKGEQIAEFESEYKQLIEQKLDLVNWLWKSFKIQIEGDAPLPCTTFEEI